VRDHPGFIFVHGDITTPGLAEELLRTHAVTILVHFAAESHVDRSIAGPDAFLRANISGTHELLKAARVAGLGAVPPRLHRRSVRLARPRCAAVQ
jgi:dTDP-glucose 4,6-dehydratase